MQMTGRDIFDFAVRDVANNIQEVMKDKPVDYLLLHQANLRIIEKIARKVKMPQEKFLTNMDKYGNTSAASIPILLDEAVSSGKITLGKTAESNIYRLWRRFNMGKYSHGVVDC